MKNALLLCALLPLLVVSAACQTDTAPPAPPEPPVPPEPPAPERVAPPLEAAPVPPPEPAPKPAEPPAPVPKPEPPAPQPVPQPVPQPDPSAYPDWIVREFPRSALQFLQESPEVGVVLGLVKVLARPLIFLAVILFVGLLLSRLTVRVVAPRSRDQMEGYQQDDRTARHLATGRLVAWAVALAIASEAIGLHWILALLNPIARLVGMALIAAMIFTVGGLIVSALGGEGREILLSFLGYFYLRWHHSRPGEDDEFDLGDGVIGTVDKVGLLHTTFMLSNGTSQTRPNAWLMRGHFHWSEPAPTARPAEPQPPDQP